MAITYEAKGDGNCAFNAFALYLADATQNGDFDGDDKVAKKRQQLVLTLFKEAGLFDEKIQWDGLKQYIKTQTTKEQLAALQIALAKVLRTKSIKLIGKEGDRNYQEYVNRTTQALLAAYGDFKNLGITKTAENDDIFRRHAFIAAKFATLKDKADDAIAKELTEWWGNEGIKTFLAQMAKPGEESGDAELVPLAYHFGLDFNYARKNANPRPLTQYAFGQISLDQFEKLSLPDDFSYNTEKESILGKEALLRYLTNAEILAGKPADDKNPYKILVQDKDELIKRLKSVKDKNDKTCPDDVITAFVAVWEKHKETQLIKSVTLRNDYAAHWNYEADRESTWLAPLKIAATVKTSETVPVKKIADTKNFYYEFLSSKQVKDLKVSEPDANGRIEITGKLNNHTFDLQVTQTSVTTKSTHPDALKLLVEATAKRIEEEGLPKSVSVDTADAATMKTIIAECNNFGIKISNLEEVQKKIAELDAAKKAEQAKPAAPAMDPMKMLEQFGKGPTPYT